MKIDELKVNQLINPLGYDFSFLNLSWKVKETTACFLQKVQLRIWKDQKQEVYNTGVLKDYHQCELSIDVALEPRTRYYWQIWAMDGNWNSCLSEIAWFETAKGNEPWSARWISPERETKQMPVLHKSFDISSRIHHARIYFYGLGLYELYLNGQKVGDEYLKPGYHSYDCRMEYQTFDVGELLVEGENEIEVLLGEGWYKGRFGFDGDYYNLYGDRKKCIGELRLTYEDGSTECIGTDHTWSCDTSTILSNGIYDGEIIDETVRIEGIGVEELDDTTELLCERTNPPVRKVTQYEPVGITHHPNGYDIVDFGRVITGWVEFEGFLVKGQTVLLQHAELLQDGDFYRENLRTAKAELQFTSKGGYEKAAPHFTYYGFRYVKVSGLEEGQMLRYRAYRLMSDIERTGEIKTSNEEVNTLFINTLRSQKCNFLDIPTDCPQRDERMGWTGDVTAFAGTACFHMNSSAFFRHYLKCVRAEQRLCGGAVPFFAPRPKVRAEENTNPFYQDAGACTWGDVATVLPWKLYEFYGNKQLLMEHYPIMCDWVDYMTGRARENEIPYLWQNDRQLGDWLALDNGNLLNPIGKTDQGLIASAWYYHSTVICEKAANELGDVRGAEFQNQRKAIYKSFLDYYYNEVGELTVEPTQTACAMLLFFGLYDSRSEQYLLGTLVRLIEENGNKLNTGFVGTPILCPVLSEHNRNDLAYTLLLNREYPGWLHEVKLGATTVWERWNSLDEDGHISSTGMNSLNHYAYGSISEWMYQYMCGFHPHMQKAVCMTIRPMPDKRIQHAAGKWNSPYGVFVSEWLYEGDRVSYHFEIPCNATAEIVLPSGYSTCLPGGSYRLSENGTVICEQTQPV